MVNRCAERRSQLRGNRSSLLLSEGRGESMAFRTVGVFFHRMASFPAEGGHGKRPWKTG